MLRRQLELLPFHHPTSSTLQCSAGSSRASARPRGCRFHPSAVIQPFPIFTRSFTDDALGHGWFVDVSDGSLPATLVPTSCAIAGPHSSHSRPHRRTGKPLDPKTHIDTHARLRLTGPFHG